MLHNTRLIVATATLSLGAAACASNNDRAMNRSADRSMQSRQAEMREANTAFISTENIREVQRVLKSQGYDPGRADGKLDEATRQALRKVPGHQ